jgi:hypothetical protein
MREPEGERDHPRMTVKLVAAAHRQAPRMDAFFDAA